MEGTRTALIRALNDQLRQTRANGQIVATTTVVTRGPCFVAAALCAIAATQQFDIGNDPWGEHDFGEVMINDERLFWKIDYYDTTLTYAAEDPSDPAHCERVLTIMFAEEY